MNHSQDEQLIYKEMVGWAHTCWEFGMFIMKSQIFEVIPFISHKVAITFILCVPDHFLCDVISNRKWVMVQSGHEVDEAGSWLGTLSIHLSFIHKYFHV